MLKKMNTVNNDASVGFDNERIWRYAGGRKMEVRWNELIGVAIETTDLGPAEDDVFFLIVGDSGTVVCPSEATGAKELLARLQQLPGFDNEAVILAMTCTERRTFICWDKKGKAQLKP